MKTLKIRYIVVVVALISVFTTLACVTKKAADPWPVQMQRLSEALASGFPFLYSSREFRDSKNHDAIVQTLNELTDNLHDLNEPVGKILIGEEPLITNAKEEMRKQLEKARQQYEAKRFDESQALVHQAVQRCFECHTSHRIGPQFTTRNEEVVGIATPFHSQKIIVLGALRELDGAMKVAEDNVKGHFGSKRVADISSMKLYLLIALRATGTFDRAAAFLTESLGNKSLNAQDRADLQTWITKIERWKSIGLSQASLGGAGSRDETLIDVIFENARLHASLTAADIKSADKKRVYKKLAANYEKLGIPELSSIGEIYKKAN